MSPPPVADYGQRRAFLSKLLLHDGDPDAAVAEARAEHTDTINACFHDRRPVTLNALARALLVQAVRDHDRGGLLEARELLEAEKAQPAQVLPTLAMVLHTLGDTQAHAQAVQALETGWEQQPAALAEVYAWCGDVDRAFECLERVIAQKLEYKLDLLPTSPLIPQAMRDDPRWKDALLRIHRLPGQLEPLRAQLQLQLPAPPMPPGAYRGLGLFRRPAGHALSRQRKA